MDKYRVLYVSQEITPYLPESEMGLTGRHLPQNIQEKGHEIRTFMPRYGSINERRHQLHEVIRLSGMNIIIDDTDHPLIIKVASIQPARMQVYFIDNEEYFHRKAILNDENGRPFADNDERAVFFCRSVLETVKKLGWAPDIVHCQGWITALLPALIKKSYNEDPLFAEAKVIYSVGDDRFGKKLNKRFHEKAIYDGMVPEDLKVAKDPDYDNITRLAVQYSDGAILGSSSLSQKTVEIVQENCNKVMPHPEVEDDAADLYEQFYAEVCEDNTILAN